MATRRDQTARGGPHRVVAQRFQHRVAPPLPAPHARRHVLSFIGGRQRRQRAGLPDAAPL